MWFTISILWSAYGLSDGKLALRNYYWFAQNEADLPDLEWVFDAFNGYGTGAAIRDSETVPYSLSVGDYVAIRQGKHFGQPETMQRVNDTGFSPEIPTTEIWKGKADPGN